jgi:hypothetical protein
MQRVANVFTMNIVLVPHFHTVIPRNLDYQPLFFPGKITCQYIITYQN